MRIGTVVRRLREEQRLSRTDLEALSGVSANTIYEIETHRHYPRIDTLYLISNALDVPLHEIIERSDTL